MSRTRSCPYKYGPHTFLPLPTSPMDSTLAYPYLRSNSRAGQVAPPSLPSFQNFFVRHEGGAMPPEGPTEQQYFNTSSANIHQRNLPAQQDPIFSPHFNPLDFSSPRAPLAHNSAEEFHERHSPSLSPSPSPAAPPPSLTPVITTQAVDNLAKDFRCTEAQRSILHTLVRVRINTVYLPELLTQ